MSERRVTPRVIAPLSSPTLASGAGIRFPLSPKATTLLVRRALVEDQAFKDVTTAATVLSNRRERAVLVARAAGSVAGVPLAVEAFRLLDPKVSIRVDVDEGAAVTAGSEVAFVSGHARALLSGERVALNFLQRLSGIATLTRQFVDAIAGTHARIYDTRKTTPGWRALEKYAVRAGGGTNHRMDLNSAVLIKDNHLAAADGNIARAVKRCRALAPEIPVQVECDTPEQVNAALAAGADGVLLDNMPVSTIADCVRRAEGRAFTEASGGVTLATVRAIAETGVDRISIGALTHSAPALDLALDFGTS